MPRRRRVRKRTLGWWKNKILGDLVTRFLFPLNDGSYVLAENWDNMIILDACRYDIFNDVISSTEIRGRLEWRFSRGTTTSEFLRQNFGGDGRLEDIVYVAANPMVRRFLPVDRFFETIPAWGHGGWDKKANTVLPDTVYKLACETIGNRHGKRFVIHFLQPHAPFVGYRHLLRIPTKRTPNPLLVYDNQETKLWSSVKKETLLSLHKKNLLLVIPYVELLLCMLPGITVITSDHGEAFGEKLHPLIPISVYGHAERTRITALKKVPWFVVKSSKKRQTESKLIVPENAAMTKEEEDLVNQRLSALGYV